MASTNESAIPLSPEPNKNSNDTNTALGDESGNKSQDVVKLNPRKLERDKLSTMWVKLNGEWQEATVILAGNFVIVASNAEVACEELCRVNLVGKQVRTLEPREVRAEAPRRNCFVVESSSSSSETSSNEEQLLGNDASVVENKEEVVSREGSVVSLMFSSVNANDSLVWLALLKRATISEDTFGKQPYVQSLRSAGLFEQPNLKVLANATVIDTPYLFRQKLVVCSACWHFSQHDPNQDTAAKEYKRRTLVELVQFVDAPRAQHAFIDDRALLDLVKTISLNIFRPVGASGINNEMPAVANGIGPYMEPQWPHLSIVYELLLHVVESGLIPLDMKKRCFTSQFCIDIFQLFRSNDMREREYVKMVTHCLYSRLMNRRACMRKAIGHVFLEYITISKSHEGIAEMLEVYGSVASGFAVPIKQEHKDMLTKCLFPLHKSRDIESFHEQLCFIFLQYSSKEPELCVQVIDSLLRYWPKSHAGKQVLFLNELEELLEVMKPEQLQQVQDRVLRQLFGCIESIHFQVAERAIALWNNETLCSAVLENREMREIVFPSLFSSLYRTWKHSWNANVRQLAEGLLGYLQALDFDMYHRCETMRVTQG